MRGGSGAQPPEVLHLAPQPRVLLQLGGLQLALCTLVGQRLPWGKGHAAAVLNDGAAGCPQVDLAVLGVMDANLPGR